MVVLDKTGIVAEVDLSDSETGAKIGTGILERTKYGHVIVCVCLDKIPEYATRGFTIGPIFVREEKEHLS